MPATQQTTSPTEADLEAAIHEAVSLAFPWLPSDSVRHQTKFSFTFGRRTIVVDGKEKNRVEGRSDVVLYSGDTPLAVLELKRAGLALKAEDDAQGLSYARVLSPSPPLVVVTNGKDMRLIETYSGKAWEPKQRSEQAFQHLLANTASLAAADLKNAIETLLGSRSVVWMQAVRQASAEKLEEISAAWGEAMSPFARDFLIPRRATAISAHHLGQGCRLVLVEGPPLSGKSNVLRDLCVSTQQSPSTATLFVEAGVGAGILQSLADSLSTAMSWSASRDDVRSWLMRVSQEKNHKLLLAVDGLDVSDATTIREIEDLSSSAFGPGLCIAVSVDDTTAETLVKRPGGLAETPIGRRARRVAVLPLNDEEFLAAQKVLAARRVRLMHGADFCAEYRQPWILRAMSAQQPTDVDDDRALALPPLLSLELVNQARGRLTDPELRRCFQGLAKAVMDDMQDQSRNTALTLESFDVYVVRRATLLQHLDATDLAWLARRGLVKAAMHASGDPVLFVRLPELMASELALLLADELGGRARRDHIETAAWIASASAKLPLGDVVAAQAIFDATQRPGSLPFGVVAALVESLPRRQPLPPGTRFALHIPEVGKVELVLQEDGSAVAEVAGRQKKIDFGEGGIGETLGNSEPWLILSHLVGVPFALEGDEGLRRADPQILLIVGSADIVLRKPGGDPMMQTAPVHDVPGFGSMVCHEAGIIEPITFSIFQFLARGEDFADDWIDDAIETGSMPLLCRIQIALARVASLADERVATWAADVLTSKVRPALARFPQLHPGAEG